MRLWIILGVFAVAILAAIIFGDDGEIVGMRTGQFMSVVVGGSLLVFMGVSALQNYGGKLGGAARDALIWIGLALALVLGYSFRDDVQSLGRRITGELMPPGEAQSVGSASIGEQAIRIRKRSDGHFIARGTVNGADMTMMVDTGASTVVLKPTDARAAGIDLDALTYSVPVRTANGTAYAAAVRIKRMAIGGIVVDEVEALVSKPGALSESLLGMSFLKRLRSYEFSGDFLTLRG